jgi:hypothetical protein
VEGAGDVACAESDGESRAIAAAAASQDERFMRRTSSRERKRTRLYRPGK